jgi:hypothetical protein
MLGETSCAEDTAVARPAEEVNFDSVTKAIESANALGALGWGSLVVPASGDVAGPRVDFAWYEEAGTTFDRGPGDYLDISYVVQRNPDPSSSGHSIVEITWTPDELIVDLGVRLIRLMQREGFTPEASTLDIEVAIKHLQRGLADAMRAKRGDTAAWFTAPLYEVITSELVITAAGVEHRQHGVVISSDDFPERPRALNDSGRRSRRESFAPAKPEWCEDDVWHVAIKRGLYVHPLEPVPAAAMALNTRIPKGSHRA